ncbi:MAG TPA: methyltransferase domain-containing protein [Thermoanaerobaculia bacterium]
MTLIGTMSSIVEQFPPELRAALHGEIPRYAFDVGVTVAHTPKGGRVCDIGGGWGAFALGSAAAGLRAILVDDFGDRGFYDEATMSVMQKLYAKYGVEVISRDVVANQLDFGRHTLDTITAFDTLEHWHHSPKRLLQSVTQTLKPGGTFILATPNCVNLRKRITVPLGRGKWSAMADWYEQEVFRGHVREPDVDDLRYIARDMKLQDVRVIGRNWAGYAQRGPIRKLMPVIDRVLRFRPSLCSDLYMIGKTAS